MDSVSGIIGVTDSLKKVLMTKNLRYGDSALTPIKFFSNLSGEEALKVRLDDKLSRIQNSEELRKNDVVDLMGYLALLCISKGWTDFDDLID